MRPNGDFEALGNFFDFCRCSQCSDLLRGAQTIENGADLSVWCSGAIDFHHKLGVALGDAGWSLSLADADDALLLARQRVDRDRRGRRL